MATRNSQRYVPWILAIGFALLFVASLMTRSGNKSFSPPSNTNPAPVMDKTEEQAQVTKEGNLAKRVIDGDTIELENGTRVRYIGIDTPERDECFSAETTEANKQLVDGKRVRLETDVQKLDQYGRTLAYVYVGEVFVNKKLVENGYAKVSTFPPNVKYVEIFQAAQKQARENKRGLWADGVCDNSSQISARAVPVNSDSSCVIKGNISSSGEKIYHTLGQRYYQRTYIDESKGERWFCNENEAQNAGWRKSKI